MNKEELFEYFNKNKECFMEGVEQIFFCSDKPDEYVCCCIESGLKELAISGNKDAAALYGAIVAYSMYAWHFSEETILPFFADPEITDKYKELIRNNFEGIVDEDELVYLLTYPTIIYFKKLSDINKPTTESNS